MRRDTNKVPFQTERMVTLCLNITILCKLQELEGHNLVVIQLLLYAIVFDFVAIGTLLIVATRLILNVFRRPYQIMIQR